MSCIKRTVVYSVMCVFVFSAICSYSVYAENVDGDISNNPWEYLFKQNSGGNNSIKIKRLTKTKIISAVRSTKKSRKAKIVLKKVKKASGYQIKYSTNKKFKRSKTKTVNTKKTKTTIKKIKSGKKYYVKARAYSKVKSKKVYGSWSKAKVIKVLKQRN